MRQPQKPWDAIGMSRASWYRHGKPTEKPRKLSTPAQEAAKGGLSTRSYQRFMRILASGDDDLVSLVRSGMKFGQVERLLLDPKLKRRFLARLRQEEEK